MSANALKRQLMPRVDPQMLLGHDVGPTPPVADWVRRRKVRLSSVFGRRSVWTRLFTPPFWPPDFMGCASGLHDGPLFGRAESPREAGQSGFDEPWF
jgi:hypothetical protein